LIMTLVEPHPGHAIGYNRWYEEDHLYATLLGPGAMAGARFVARRHEKARRRVQAPFDPGAGSLLAVYWLADDGSEHRAFRASRAGELEAAGRVYRERDFVLGFDGRSVLARSRTGGVPPELALDHRFGHLVVSVVEPAPGRSAEEAAVAYDAHVAAGLLGAGSPVEICTAFSSIRAADPRQGRDADPPRSADDLVVLWFCRTDPALQWDELLDLQERGVEEGGDGRVAWVSPFVPTVVGTDTYMDELR
jgi:hypothetical protein